MNIAAAGGLILYFSVLIALIVVALVVFAYAAYSFLVVLSTTAAGYDEVTWPGDPIPDWFFKGWYLGWLLAVWLVPATFLAALLRLPGPHFALCVAVCLWLLFPVGLLSSLSSESRLAVFRPMMVRLLLQHPGVALRFYASSGLVVLVSGVLGYAAAFGLHFLQPPMHKSATEIRFRLAAALDQPLILVPLAGVLGAAGCLIYARLLGRTACLTGQTRSEKRSLRTEKSRPAEESRPRPREQASPESAKKRKLRAKGAPRAVDPWAIPAAEPPRRTIPRPSKPALPEDPYGPAEGTYDLSAADAPIPPSSPLPGYSRLEPEEPEPYAVSKASQEPPRELPMPYTPEDAIREAALAAPRLLPPLPKRPFVTGVYSFPFYPQTIGPWATLGFGFFLVLALTRLLFTLYPL